MEEKHKAEEGGAAEGRGGEEVEEGLQQL